MGGEYAGWGGQEASRRLSDGRVANSAGKADSSFLTVRVIIGRLEVEADERWSFVANKANKQGVWITMDQHTRHIIACHVGERRDASGHQWWVNLLAVSRERAMFSPDHYAVSTGVIPATQHKAMTKHARKTNHIERFTNTMRPRVSRLVRDTLACAKQLANHIGAITSFLCQYNLTRAAA